MQELPKIISVDDHVLEPAHVFTDRLPAKFAQPVADRLAYRVADRLDGADRTRGALDSVAAINGNRDHQLPIPARILPYSFAPPISVEPMLKAPLMSAAVLAFRCDLASAR